MTTIRDESGRVVMHFSHASQQTPQGADPILVEKDADCPDCGSVHDLEKCPKCGAWITHGFGLMGGGFGPYKFCNNEQCDWFWKECHCMWCEDPIGDDEPEPGVCRSCYDERIPCKANGDRE
jgi:hypothetical protein